MSTTARRKGFVLPLSPPSGDRRLIVPAAEKLKALMEMKSVIRTRAE
jgi:hypothetical protein